MASETEGAVLPATALPADRADGATRISDNAMSGAIYLAVRYGLGVLVSVGNMLVMTWWIGPHAYGLFVTAVGIISFFAMLSRGGIDIYLVRAEATDSRMYGTATTLILAISLGLALAAAAATPLFVQWYGNREFVLPYFALLVVIPVSALAAIPIARLERGLEFRRIAGIELAGNRWASWSQPHLPGYEVVFGLRWQARLRGKDSHWLLLYPQREIEPGCVSTEGRRN